MRILLGLHHYIGPDAGAPRVVYRLREELAALGHHVESYSFDDLKGVPDKAKPFVFPAYFAANLARRRRDFDVVDASCGDGWIAYRGRGHGGPLRVTHSHGLEHLYARSEKSELARHGRTVPRRKSLYRYGWRLAEVGRSLRGSDLCLMLNDGEARFLTETLGIARARVEVVKNAVEDAVLSAPLVMPPGEPIVVAQVGAYIARKGVAYTAAAMAPLMARHPTLRLRFLGTGAPREAVLADYPAALHDRIEVTPRYPNGSLPQLLEGAAIQIMPSLFEGSPVAKLEGMARGLVPVVSDDAGTSVQIVDGENGLIVPVADAAALGAAVERLVIDPALRGRLRESALVTARGTNWAAVAASRIESYARALDRRDGAIATARPGGLVRE
jgi:glycosyltransferase involved in cell wall biosynthesis